MHVAHSSQHNVHDTSPDTSHVNVFDTTPIGTFKRRLSSIAQNYNECFRFSGNLISVPIELRSVTCITKLTLSHCGLTNISHIPESVTELDITDNNIRTIANEHIPKFVTKLDISDNPLHTIQISNTNVKHLTMYSSNFSHGMIKQVELPKMLIELDVCQYVFTDYTFLRGLHVLHTLNLTNVSIFDTDLDCIPNSVCYLDLSENDQLINVTYLPNSIYKLNLSDCPKLRSIDCDIPDTLRSLHIANCNVSQIPSLPRTMTYLNLIDNPIQLSIGELPDIITKGFYVDALQMFESGATIDEYICRNVHDNPRLQYHVFDYGEDKYLKESTMNNVFELSDSDDEEDDDPAYGINYHRPPTPHHNVNHGMNYGVNYSVNHNYNSQASYTAKSPHDILMEQFVTAKYNNKNLFNVNNVKFCEIPDFGDIGNINHIRFLNCDIDLVANIPNVEKLSLSSNRIKVVYDKCIPTSVTELDLSHNNIDNIDISSSNVLKLNLSYNSLSQNLSLCNSLVELDISRAQMASLSSLSNLTNLHKLCANHCNIINIDGIPDSVKIIRMYETCVSAPVTRFPKSLTDLCINKSKFNMFNFDRFPTSLTKFVALDFTMVGTMPIFPNIMESINVTRARANINIQSLPYCIDTIKIKGIVPEIRDFGMYIKTVNNGNHVKTDYKEERVVNNFHTNQLNKLMNKPYGTVVHNRHAHNKNIQFNRYGERITHGVPNVNYAHQNLINRIQEERRAQHRANEEKKRKMRENMKKMLNDTFTHSVIERVIITEHIVL